jgi:hypothetical protein
MMNVEIALLTSVTELPVEDKLVNARDVGPR